MNTYVGGHLVSAISPIVDVNIAEDGTAAEVGGHFMDEMVHLPIHDRRPHNGRLGEGLANCQLAQAFAAEKLALKKQSR